MVRASDESPAGGEPFVFEGIDSPNGTIFPDVLLDRVMAHLSGAEFKVLAYIVRRTFGFKKDTDSISLDQICHGIVRRDGSILDEGTGLTRKTAIAALKGLEEKGVVVVQRRSSPTRGNLPSTFALRFRPISVPSSRRALPAGDPDEEREDDPAYATEDEETNGAAASTPGVQKPHPRGAKTIPPLGERRYPRGVISAPGRGTNRYPQQTEGQPTDDQQTENTTEGGRTRSPGKDRPAGRTRESAPSLSAAQAQALALLVGEGVSASRALDLCLRFPVAEIEQQVAWLDGRRYDDRAACLVAAIEGGYGAPVASSRRHGRLIDRRDAGLGGEVDGHAVRSYSQGPYGVCPSCGCSPCDASCPAPRRPARPRPSSAAASQQATGEDRG